MADAIPWLLVGLGNPGAKYADHARGNVALRRTLDEIFATRTTAEWVHFGQEVNTPLCPVKVIVCTSMCRTQAVSRPRRKTRTRR